MLYLTVCNYRIIKERALIFFSASVWIVKKKIYIFIMFRVKIPVSSITPLFYKLVFNKVCC